MVSNKKVVEFSLKAVATGIGLGVLFGAANTYLGLRVGMTVSASIPAVVMTLLIFKALRQNPTLLELNMSQTIGSASTALATGSLFTIPALFFWGVIPSFYQIAILCFLGGVLGVSAMVPLRKLLIVDAHDELPFPEGTACAQVLKSSVNKSKNSNWILGGMAVGVFVKFLVALFFVFPSEAIWAVPFIKNAEIALELAPALVGVGYILGYRQAGVSVAGSVLSALVLIPLISLLGDGVLVPVLPEKSMLISQMTAGQVWSKYIRYIGAGAVACAGLLTITRSLPTLTSAVRGVFKGLMRKRNELSIDETSRDIPSIWVVGGILIVFVVPVLFEDLLGSSLTFSTRFLSSLCIGVLGTLFVTVTARIVGIVGVTSQPTSAIAILTLLLVSSLFAFLGWREIYHQAAIIMIGTVVTVAASKSGDISQDLKTGYLVGATPAKQQMGQLLGAAFACWGVAATLILLGKVYGFGSKEIPAPQAMLMKTIVEGVLSGDVPWGLVLTGVGITLNGMMCGVSGLAYAIGVYLPLSSMAPIFLGGLVQLFLSRKKSYTASDEDPGVLAASGLIAGEGLSGVGIALLVTLGWIPKSGQPVFSNATGSFAVLFIMFLISLFLYRAGSKGR